MWGGGARGSQPRCSARPPAAATLQDCVLCSFCRAGYLLPTDIAVSTHPPTYPSRNVSHEAPTHPQAAEHRPRRCRNKWRVLALAGPLRPRRLIVWVVPAPPSRGRHGARAGAGAQVQACGRKRHARGFRCEARPVRGVQGGRELGVMWSSCLLPRPPSGRRKMHRLLLRRRRNFFPPARGQRGGRAPTHPSKFWARYIIGTHLPPTIVKCRVRKRYPARQKNTIQARMEVGKLKPYEQWGGEDFDPKRDRLLV